MLRVVGRPVLFEAWTRSHKPADDLSPVIKDGYHNQIFFIQNTLPLVLAKTMKEHHAMQRGGTTVIATYGSEPLLPVVQVELADGTKFIMGHNYRSWKVSVDCPYFVEADFMGLFDSKKRIEARHCEGFPKELVYGPFSETMKQFTIELLDNHHLFTFLWIFSYQVLGIKKR